MSETADKEVCPRCGSDDTEREVIYQTTEQIVSGVVFFCNTCAMTTRALSSDREKWFDSHKLWQSPNMAEQTIEAFLARWPKRVGSVAYGSPEPLGPILPKVD